MKLFGSLYKYIYKYGWVSWIWQTHFKLEYNFSELDLFPKEQVEGNSC